MNRLNLSLKKEIHEVYDEDDYYFSVEPIDNENGEDKEDQDVTGATSSSEVQPDEPVQKSAKLERIFPYTPGRVMKRRRIGKKKSTKRRLKRSPLMMMMTMIWNLLTLMILMK